LDTLILRRDTESGLLAMLAAALMLAGFMAMGVATRRRGRPIDEPSRDCRCVVRAAGS